MGIYVRRFEDVYRAIEMVPPEGRLFCFFAIDDRPSHRELLSVLEYCLHWIDDLSATSGIYSFLPASRWSKLKNPPGFMFAERLRSREESDFLSTFEEQECYTNPSLILARKFGITPRELPGLVVFKALPESPPREPLFIPLDPTLLSDHHRFEAVIAELFSRVQEAWDGARQPGAVLESLRGHLPEIGIGIRFTSAPVATIGEVFNEAVSSARVDHTEDVNFRYIRHAERKEVKLFISYAREDKDDADFLFRRFSEAGFAPWMDKQSIVPGEKWERAIQCALKKADFFVACLSSISVRKRGYLQREFKFALDKWREFLEDDIYIIPIRLDNCEIPAELSGFQWIDLYRARGASMWRGEGMGRGEGGWERIIQAITEGIRRRRS